MIDRINTSLFIVYMLQITLFAHVGNDYNVVTEANRCWLKKRIPMLIIKYMTIISHCTWTGFSNKALLYG